MAANQILPRRPAAADPVEALSDRPKAEQPAAPRGYTPAELARLLRVSPDRVRAWIKSGELPALNVATHRCGRPRFVILPQHLAEFEKRRRAATPVAKPSPRKRRATGIVDYYPD